MKSYHCSEMFRTLYEVIIPRSVNVWLFFKHKTSLLWTSSPARCQCLLYLPSHFKHLSHQGVAFKGSTPVHIHRLHRRSFVLHTRAQLCPHFPQLQRFERRRHPRWVDSAEAKSTTTTTKSDKTGEKRAPVSTLHSESRVRLTIFQPFQALMSY